jgi:hypothetical protein
MKCNCKARLVESSLSSIANGNTTQDSAEIVDLQIEINIAESIYTPLKKWKQPALCSYLNL